MSEIATLEMLEPFLAQVVTSSRPSKPVETQPMAAMPNGRQGSHLEVFFSEVRYSTFVEKKKPVTPKMRQPKSSNAGEGALKYSLRLH